MYLATKSTKLNSMERILARAKLAHNPRTQAILDLIELIKELKTKHGNGVQIICTGDWNFDITDDDGSNPPTELQAKTRELISSAGLINVQDKWVKDRPRTFKPSESTNERATWIDHTLVTHTTINEGGCYATAVLQHQRIANSDHRPQLLGLRLAQCLGIEGGLERVNLRRKRTLLATHPKSAKAYKRAMKKVLRENPTLQQRIKNLFKWAKKIKRKPEFAQQRATLQDLANRQMAELMALMLDAEDAMPKHKEANGGTRRRKDGWSPKIVSKTKELRKIISLMKRAKLARRKQREELYASIHQTYGMKFALNKMPTGGRNSNAWKEWEKENRTKLKDRFAKLKASHRNAERMKMNKHVADIEKMRQNSRTKGKYYNYVRAKTKSGQSALVVGVWVDKDGERVMEMNIGKEAVIQQENIYLPEHMGGAKNPYFKNRQGQQHPFLGKNDGAKEKRRKYQCEDGRLEKIPEPFTAIFEHAKVKSSSITGEPITELVRDIFTTEIEKENWKQYIAAKKKNTSPGKSGVRVDHVAAAPTAVKEMTRKMLSLPYLCGTKFECWNEEIIAWLPKEENNPDIARRRPITLLEVMKKMHIGVKKQAFISVALQHGMIGDEHFGALPKRSTTEPLMKKIIALEDALRARLKLYGADVDLRRAFDMVPVFIKEMALRRIGMPEEGIALWSAYDLTKRTRSITAYGFSDAITPVAGAFGQGAEESPFGFVAYCSWLTDYLDSLERDPYYLSTDKRRENPIKQSYFVDDSTFMSSSLDGLQKVIHGVCKFCFATGMEINFEKSFYTIVVGDELLILTIKCIGVVLCAQEHTKAVWTKPSTMRLFNILVHCLSNPSDDVSDTAGEPMKEVLSMHAAAGLKVVAVHVASVAEQALNACKSQDCTSTLKLLDFLQKVAGSMPVEALTKLSEPLMRLPSLGHAGLAKMSMRTMDAVMQSPMHNTEPGHDNSEQVSFFVVQFLTGLLDLQPSALHSDADPAATFSSASFDPDLLLFGSISKPQSSKGVTTSEPIPSNQDSIPASAQAVARMNASLLSAMLGDSVSLTTHYEYDSAKIRQAYEGEMEPVKLLPPGWLTGGSTSTPGLAVKQWHPGKGAGHQTDYGDYCLMTMEFVVEQLHQGTRRFEAEAYHTYWRGWIQHYTGYINFATKETLENMRTHGSSRADEDALAAAARDASTITHRAELAQSAAEFFARVTHKVIAHQGRLRPSAAIEQTVKEMLGLESLTNDQGGMAAGVNTAASRQSAAFWALLGLRKAEEAAGPNTQLSQQPEALVDDYACGTILGGWPCDASEADLESDGGEAKRRECARMGMMGKASEASTAVAASVYFIARYEALSVRDALVANALVGGDNACRALPIGMVLGAFHGDDKRARGRILQEEEEEEEEEEEGEEGGDGRGRMGDEDEMPPLLGTSGMADWMAQLKARARLEWLSIEAAKKPPA
eukprot:g477.t1